MDSNLQIAAELISELLAPALQNAEEHNRRLHDYERFGIEWLRKQWKADPSLNLNMWVASRFVWNENINLRGKMPNDGGPCDDKEFTVRKD